jgi:hypothetical protein
MTRADRTVGNAVYEYAAIDGLYANLRPGENVIAVELHQVNSTSSDVAFGLAVDVVIRRTVQTEDPLEGGSIIVRLPCPLQAAILRMEYCDAWYPSTDGDVYAMVIRDVTADRADWNRASVWLPGQTHTVRQEPLIDQHSGSD